MLSYLSYKFEDTPEFISTFDELPLWSAPFGLLLLKHIEYKQGLTVLDTGSGAGFPLMEIAARLGSSSKCFGLDPWTNANNRAKQKIKNYGLTNVEVIEGSAEKIPFGENYFDLIVSNLGINNFGNPPGVLAECLRTLKPGGKLVITTNLNGHWKEFYDVFEDTLRQLKLFGIIDILSAHQEHRGTSAGVMSMLTDAGFASGRVFEDSFEMQFADGSAFLDHHFVKLGWLSSWIDLLAGENVEEIFTRIETNLNDLAAKQNGLRLTVPMAFIEGIKR